MQLTLTLWFASLMLGLGGDQYQPTYKSMEPKSVAEERLEAGPLSLELRLRHFNRGDPWHSSWPVSSMRVDSEFSASVAPFRIRLVMVIDLDSAPDSKIAEGGLHQKYKGPPHGRAFAVAEFFDAS